MQPLCGRKTLSQLTTLLPSFHVTTRYNVEQHALGGRQCEINRVRFVAARAKPLSMSRYLIPLSRTQCTRKGGRWTIADQVLYLCVSGLHSSLSALHRLTAHVVYFAFIKPCRTFSLFVCLSICISQLKLFQRHTLAFRDLSQILLVKHTSLDISVSA